MAYTTPRSWTNGEVVTASIMDTHVRDNFNAILSSGTTLNSTIVSSSLTSVGVLTGLTMGGDAVFQDNQSVALGTGSDSTIYYDGTDTVWNLRAVGSGDLMIALETGFPSPDPNSIHVWRGTAGVVTANSSAHFVLEDNADSYINFLTPAANTAGLLVGEPNSNAQAFIYYTHSGGATPNTWRIGTETSERLNYSANAFTFLEATTLSTSTGNLTLYCPAGSDIILGDNTTLIHIDGGLHGGVGGIGIGVAPGANDMVLEQMPALTATANQDISRHRISWGGAVTIPAGVTSLVGSLTIDEPNITATGTVTNAFSVRISGAPTEGSNNYAFWIDDGAARFDSSLFVESTPTEGSAGEQLTSGGSGAVMTWAAAACMAESKKNIVAFSDASQALTLLLNTPIYKFQYKDKWEDFARDLEGNPVRNLTTGDLATEYVGPMAHEAPWAMHHEGRILNPINTFGYTVLAIKELERRLTALGG